MATRILFDPRQDLPDGTTSPTAVTVEATPTAIRTDGAVVIFPTTQRFTVSSAADPIILATPGAGQAWRLVVRRGSSHLEQRTVTWTDAATTTWAALTDVDPATLMPTPDVVASWDTALTGVTARVDAVLNAAPGNLDTFFEVATQMGLDEATVTTLTALVAGKADTAAVAATYPTKANNLSDLASAATARTNLGLGSAATHAATDFDAAGAAAAVTLTGLGGITPSAVDAKVSTAVTNLLNGTPGALDTLKELADALGDDPNFATTLTNLVSTKLAALTGTTTLTAAGNLTIGVQNLLDATSGAFTATLPTPTTVGQLLTIERADASANLISIAGTVRGVASTVTLPGAGAAGESVAFFAESLSSWRILSSHKPKALLDKQYDALGAAKASTADAVLFVSPTGNNSNDGLSRKSALATLSAAITALAGGGTIELAAGTHPVSTALPQPANNTLIRGLGAATQINWTGSGTMLTLTNARQIHFENLRVTATLAGQTLFYLSNTFRCSWRQCVIEGQHSNTTGSTYYGQVGFQFRGNSGDNRILDSDLNNLGEAIQSDTIMNYLIGSVVGNCYTGVHIDAGTATGGMAVDMCTFVGTAIGAAYVRAHVLIDVSANQTWITNTWMEGCTTAIQAGKNTATIGGPLGMVIANCRLAATSKCLDIQAGRQFRLEMVRFGTDVSAAPTELTIDATNAPDGFASGLLSSTTFDVSRAVFPPQWTFLSRSQSESQLASTTLYVGQGVAGGTPSYVYAGNGRVRMGYDGARTIISDAGGSRDVALVAGATPRQVVMGADGVFYVGAKTQGTANAGGAVVGIAIQNAVTLPTTNPTGGGVLYVDAGALKYRGPSGTVTTIGPA